MLGEMMLDTLPYAIPGCAMLMAMTYSMYGPMWDNGSDESAPVKEIPKAKDATEAEILKAGWELLEEINHDIHRMYHPEGCQCAFCQIRQDDKPYEAPVAERCAEPCYGCSVITCVKHPDHGPVTPKITPQITPEKPPSGGGGVVLRKPPGYPRRDGTICHDDDAPWVVYEEDEEDFDPYPAIADLPSTPDTVKQVIIRQHTAIKNLESQLKRLGDSHIDLVHDRDAVIAENKKLKAENEALKQERGVRSAGMHKNGKPLFYIDVPPPAPKWHDRQIGTIGRKCFECGGRGFKLVQEPREGLESVAVCKDCWVNFYQQPAIESGCTVIDLDDEDWNDEW